MERKNKFSSVMAGKKLLFLALIGNVSLFLMSCGSSSGTAQIDPTENPDFFLEKQEVIVDTDNDGDADDIYQFQYTYINSKRYLEKRTTDSNADGETDETTDYTYDSYGNITQRKDSELSSGFIYTYKFENTYGSDGNLNHTKMELSDNYGVISLTEYTVTVTTDSSGNKVWLYSAIDDDDGAYEKFTYDANNNLVSYEDGGETDVVKEYYTASCALIPYKIEYFVDGSLSYYRYWHFTEDVHGNYLSGTSVSIAGVTQEVYSLYDTRKYINYYSDGSEISSTDADGDIIASGEDCDDSNASLFAGDPTACSTGDQSCDVFYLSCSSVCPTWYADADGDGYGNSTADPLVDCELNNTANYYVTNASDCDDNSTATNPAAAETCDDKDNDCDGNVDEDANNQTAWYIDNDDDGFGDDSVAAVYSCDELSGFADNHDDCNDESKNVRPDANDCGDGKSNGIDNNCNGVADDEDCS